MSSTAAEVTATVGSDGTVTIVDPITNRTGRFTVTSSDGSVAGVQVLYLSDGQNYAVFLIDPKRNFAPLLFDGQVSQLVATGPKYLRRAVTLVSEVHAQSSQVLPSLVKAIDFRNRVKLGLNVIKLAANRPAVLDKQTGFTTFCYTPEGFAAEVGLQSAAIFGTLNMAGTYISTSIGGPGGHSLRAFSLLGA